MLAEDGFIPGRVATAVIVFTLSIACYLASIFPLFIIKIRSV